MTPNNTIPPDQAEQTATGWVPLIAVSLTLFIVVLDSTMMNVAISAIVQDLNTTLTTV